MRDSQIARLGALVKNAVGLKGTDPFGVETYAQPSVTLEDWTQPHMLFLGGTVRRMGWLIKGAVAGQFSRVSLAPLVVTPARVPPAAGASLVWLRRIVIMNTAAAAADFTVGAFSAAAAATQGAPPTDLRLLNAGGGNYGLLGDSLAAVPPVNIGVRLPQATSWDLHVSYVLSQASFNLFSGAVGVTCNTVNTGLSVGFEYDERVIEDTED